MRIYAHTARSFCTFRMCFSVDVTLRLCMQSDTRTRFHATAAVAVYHYLCNI